MIITYSPLHRWRKKAVSEPADLYSSKNRKRIQSTLPRLEQEMITYDIHPLDHSFLDWFVPLYEMTIATKQNAKVHDVIAATINNKVSTAKYFSFTLYQAGQRVGGAILSDRPEMLITAYKVFDTKWVSGTLQANPTLVCEYLTAKYAHSIGKEFVSHGRDRNPYGLNASIGLCTFKLSTGYAPTISSFHEDYVKETIETDGIDTDALILHYPTREDLTITDATLVTTEEQLENYNQLLSYPELLSITVQIRK